MQSFQSILTDCISMIFMNSIKLIFSKFSIFSVLILVNLMSLSVHANQAQTASPMGSNDPYETYNRAIFDFNMGFNEYIGSPVVNTYNTVMPLPAKIGIDNFLNNLTTPLSALNSLLQGKTEDGLSEIMRFSINSTFGLLGILDIATPAGLEDKKEDFGQTLYHWGVWKESNYLILPIVGPYTVRSLAGSMVDSVNDPLYNHIVDVDNSDRALIAGARGFVAYSKVVSLVDNLKNQPDPYVFARESYLQYRTNLIYDGKPPVKVLNDFNFE
ncbi:VacJ family lipoprotein [Thiomicrorhabdus aquaedulcis]|uniref:MlaA family lipoprotein n=1 Tax=Thiomicrorhabdus aquaedulcis TaxID=2211106 RepID=UPI001E608A5D|nr:VacJ family lipoprotein [Thiomicrorhabdus aquaedulcis]